MIWIRMIGAILAPVFLSVLFYFLDTKTTFGRLAVARKQIIIGIAFGILACLATQFGIPFDGYVMNVRSAAPLTAGLVFGGPAGIIAGIIGALYRWFSVYWGVPAYTRVACSVATLLAGIIAALCRKYLFDNKKTSWVYGFFIAMATEVFHMLLVFITHMDDIKTAFEVVRQTVVPMTLSCSVSLLITLLTVALISKDRVYKKKQNRPITQTFSVSLLICILLSFFATTLFTSFLQKNISRMDVEHLLSMNISDVKADILAATDKDLLSRTERIADSLNSTYFLTAPDASEGTRQRLAALMRSNDVSEISIIGKDGIILVSTNPDFDGFDMRTGGQAEEFLCLLEGAETYVQSYQPMDSDGSTSRKYAGAVLKTGGFVQVGYDSEHFQASVRDSLSGVATNRHIGQTGFLFVLSLEDATVLSAPEDTVTENNARYFVQSLAGIPDDTVLSFEDEEGVGYYYMKSNAEGYVVVGTIPVSEAEFSRDTAVYISALMQAVVFFVLFVLIFSLIKRTIVDNIHRINRSLSKITGGDLSTRVDIEDNEEFVSLSRDINATVDRLKEFIHDAEKRMDMELSFAKSIQHSVLPSAFPPYPNRGEFDIYASMDTAKEVGGDFYDFYLLDENRLVFLMADVSGKGIPAAMFMMNAKSVIKSLAESRLSVSDVFTVANEKLCASNEAGMFVTAWMGILNLKTGALSFANAGHNPPVLRRRDGSFEYMKSRPGLVLAGMEGIRYRENEITLEPGDEIFLYTDGIPEAVNEKTEMFGEERLLAVLNGKRYARAEDVCRAVKSAADSFVGTADQFDDITMLSLKYIGPDGRAGQITVPAALDSIEAVTVFAERALEEAGASPKAIMQINVAIDEIFSNIARYAYPNGKGEAGVSLRIQGKVATLTFTDSGIPFNPLAKEDPDITLSAEERGIGGLGILMVKKTMDSLDYAYRENKNILTIVKSI